MIRLQHPVASSRLLPLPIPPEDLLIPVSSLFSVSSI